VPAGKRGARYVCVLALAIPDAAAPGGLRIIERRGTTRGRIAVEPSGSGGFGYDPLFEPIRERAGGRTFGQYGAAAKDAISHRGRAARRMVPVLKSLAERRPAT
jgi:XTP/dITP diphosphohydrolase